MEEAIHVRFNDIKPDIEMSKLDGSFADIRLDEGIGPLIEQPSETDPSHSRDLIKKL